MKNTKKKKNLPTMQDMWGQLLGQEDPQRKWQLTPIPLLGKSHGQRSLQDTVHGVAKNWTRLSTGTHVTKPGSKEI